MQLTVQLDFEELLNAIRLLSPDQKNVVQRVLNSEDASYSMKSERPQRPLGTMKGLVAHISDDFDAPLTDFDAYQ
jgi:hypothetical protein